MKIILRTILSINAFIYKMPEIFAMISSYASKGFSHFLF